MSGWISKFGNCKQYLVDNGGEFVNHDFREMAEKFNIFIMTTAAQAPFQNGTNEKYNGVIGEIVKKVLADTKCTLDVALSWAVAAKNSLENYNGFSPNQLVFGFNPNYPSYLHNELPAQETTTSSDILRQNLNAMHIARQEFIKNESSEKLRRALSKWRTTVPFT